MLAGSCGLPTKVIGTSLMMPRYSKSSSGLYGSLRYSAGEAAIPMCHTSSVWPSAGARATLLAPIVPPAPVALSMTMVALSRCLRIASASWRATVSVGPPAANGTTMVMGLVGKASAAPLTVSASASDQSFLDMNVTPMDAVRRWP